MNRVPSAEQPSPVALLAVLFEAGLALLAVALGWLLGQPPWQGVEFSVSALPQLAASALWGAAAAAPLLAALWALDRFPLGPLKSLQQIMSQRVLPLFRDATAFQLGCLSLMAGLGEEMLFRGVLQRAWADWIGPPWGAWLGLLAASAAFGACHWLNRAYAVAAALIGLYLGGLYLAVGQQLIAPVTTHAVYDFLALLYLLRRSPHGRAG